MQNPQEYAVVYPENGKNGEVFYASYLHFLIKDRFGADLPLGTEAPEGKKTISFLPGSPAGTYSVSCEKGDLTVRGNDMIDFEAAMRYLRFTLFEGGNFSFGDGFSHGESTSTVREKKGEYRLIFHNVDGVERAWNRADYDRAIYSAYQPDIIGLNEYWFYLTGSGKIPVYLRELGYTEAAPEGLTVPNVQPVWYRAEKFDLLEVKYLDYDKYPAEKDTSKAATFAVLKDKKTGKTLIVVAHHLNSAYKDANGFFTQAEATGFRVEQIGMLHQVVEDFMKKYPGAPIVIGGDYNADYTDPTVTDKTNFSTQKMAEGMTYTDYPRAGALFRMQDLGYRHARDMATEKNDFCSCHNLPAFDETYGIGRNANGFLASDLTGRYYMSIDHAYVKNAENLTVDRYLTCVDALAYATSDHSPQIIDMTLK